MLALYTHAIQLTHLLRRDTKAVTAMEYGLIAALMAVAIIAAIGSLTGALTTTFATIAKEMTGA